MKKTFVATPETLRSVRGEIREILASNNVPEEIEVQCAAGQYSPDDFKFGEADTHKTCSVAYIGQAGAAIRGSLKIQRDAWQPVPQDRRDWFREDLADSIRCVDLKAFGLSSEDWGTLCAIGAYNTQKKYPDFPAGKLCEAYLSGKDGKSRRLCLARYPNKGEYDRLDNVLDGGDCAEFPAQNYFHDWGGRNNHRGGEYVMSRETAARVKTWKHADDPWLFGYFMWDWADSSTPVSINAENLLLKPKFVSRFGVRAGAKYFFYNIPEELDTSDEWYLDRNTGIVYFLPLTEDLFIEFSYRKEPLIECVNVKNLTFEHFELSGTLADAVASKDGNRVYFRHLNVFNVGGNGFVLSGVYNEVEYCEISHTGRGGCLLSGGSRRDFTPGRNMVKNCYIHNFAEVYQTYAAGVGLEGSGNVCAHNEICETPHAAVLYGGGDHLIEFNYIHDAVKESSDASAIYGGRDWFAHGTVIRYNKIEKLGSDEFAPHAIYWDDGLAGQTAYGNLIINIPGFGFLIGGGFDADVHGNILIGCGTPIHYDQRNRDGFVSDGWCREAVNSKDSVHWKQFYNSYKDNFFWKSRYPRLSRLLGIEGDPDSPLFPCNPANSKVCGNAIENHDGSVGYIEEAVTKFSDISGNTIVERAPASWYEGKTDIPGFESIPVGKIGIQK